MRKPKKQKKLLEYTRNKKPNRVRTEVVVPLTEAQRYVKILAEMERYRLLYREAELLADWGKAPNACVHSTYYAMMHATATILLIHGGVGKQKDAPRNHEDTLNHLRLLAAKIDNPESMQAVEYLATAKAFRIDVDYGGVEGASIEDARTGFNDAKTFFRICRGSFDLPE